MPGIRIHKVLCAHKESLKAFLRTGNHSRVISKQQSAQHGYTNDGKQVVFTACLCMIHHNKI